MAATEVIFIPGRRRARHPHENHEAHWAPKWRRLLLADSGRDGRLSGSDSEPPQDYTEFDRTVRGMLNRISTENNRRLLPLDPGLRGADGDCPPWWAARFAGLMLTHYLQVIHTNRGARGLTMRSPDNVLPEYLDAVGPLLAQCPRLVEALLAWLVRFLRCRELCWPTARLLLLAAREPRERSALPANSLGRLPPELVKGRILGFLAPPTLPAQTSSCPSWPPASAPCGLRFRVLVPGTLSPEEEQRRKEEELLKQEEQHRESQKDVIAVLAHLIMFAPPTTWPRLSAVAFFLVESALTGCEAYGEDRVYLAASILVTIAQRLDTKIPDVATERAREAAGPGSELHEKYPPRDVLLRDLRPLIRLADRLSELVAGDCCRTEDLSKFVHSRVKTALEVVRKVQDKLLPSEPSMCPSGPDRSPGRGRQRRCP